jgi:thiamine biosynthesis lipoprotein
MQLTLDVSDKSRGAFDPTVYPLLELWGFYDSTGSEHKPPPKEAIDSVLEFVDYTAIEINADTVDLDSQYAEGSLQVFRTFWVDLSGIAKGYAVDRAVHVLAEHGIEKGIVDAGGDIFCLGERRQGWFIKTFAKNKTKWSIGIRHPRRDNPNEIIGIIRVDQCAVATSGDYENFFDAEGVRYHHLMDPATGMPARGVISATVIAPTARQADAWATALFVMGKKGISLLDSLESLEGLIIMEDEAILTTKNFPELKER